MSSVSDEARTKMKDFLGLTGEPLLSNTDMFKLILDTPNQSFVQESDASVGTQYRRYLEFVERNVSAGNLIDELFAVTPFYIAHRGSKNDWPEHTMLAWEQAIIAGAKAIEVSLVSTLDNVVVGHHDLTVDRMTDGTGAVNLFNYADLPAIDDSLWTGPGHGVQPWPRLEEILNQFAGRAVIFIEPKDNNAVTPMFDALERIPNFEQSFIFKGYKFGAGATGAKARGMKVWAYGDFDTPILEWQDIIASGADYVGTPRRDDESAFPHTTDTQLQNLVALGVPVITWEMHRKWGRDAAVALGVQGIMASSFKHLTRAQPVLSSDGFATAKLQPGDLPRTQVPSWNPVWREAEDSVALEQSQAQSALMGSLSFDDPPDNYEITWEVAYDTVPTDVNTHWGFVFCKPDDHRYLFSSTANETDGYHVVFRSDGRLQLFTHSAGVAAGTQIGSTVNTPLPVADAWLAFKITITPTHVTLERTDSASTPISVANATRRGGYIHITRNYAINVPTLQGPVRFRNIRAAAL